MGEPLGHSRQPAAEREAGSSFDQRGQHVYGDQYGADTIDASRTYNYTAGRDINIHQGPRPEEPWPRRVGRFPKSAADALEREADRRLWSTSDQRGEATLSHVLSGMGGVGKTQLAARLAHRLWHAGELDLLVWIDASSRGSIVSDMRLAAARVTGRAADDPAVDAEHFLDWLARPTGRRWMVVLDNVTDPKDLNGLYPPDNPNGRMVITTRRRDAALKRYGTRVDVDVFTPEEAVDFLDGRLGGDAEAIRGAEELSDALGGLPLALAQAAAFIEDQHGFSCERYLGRFLDRRRRLADLAPESLPDGHVEPYAATWSLSLEAAEQGRYRGVAGAILRLASMLSPNGIPPALLDTVPGRRYLRQSINALGPTAEGEALIDEDTSTGALSRLNKLSLLDWDGDLFRVHALIQRAVFEQMSRCDREAAAGAAADALLRMWPERGRDFASASLLRANALELFQASGDALFKPAVHTVLYRAGDSLGAVGLAKAAEVYFGDLLIRSGRLGNLGRRDSIKIQRQLAKWRAEAGDSVSATANRRNVVQTLRKQYGDRHSETMRARRQLASTLGESGAVTEAITELTELRDLQAEHLGANAIETLVTRMELARWIGEGGDPMGAVTALGGILTEQRKRLPETDPQIRFTRKHLARWLGEVGEHERAIAEFRKIVEALEMEHGETHDLPLGHRFKLAQWMRKAGLRRKALTELERLLVDQQRVSHPAVLSTRRHLAVLRGDLGERERSRDELERLLVDTRERLGNTSRETFAVRREIATCRGELGDHAGAVADLERTLEDQREVLHDDHSEILHTRECIAYQRREAGDMDIAIADLRRLLDDRVRLRGEGHRETNRTRRLLKKYQEDAAKPTIEGTASPRQREALEDQEWRELSRRSDEARRQWESGERGGAIVAQEQAIAEYEHHGVDDRYILREYKRLAKWCGEVEDRARAILVLRTSMERIRRRFGDHSPTLGMCRTELVLQLHKAGACGEAVVELEQLVADHDRFNVTAKRRFNDRANLVRCRGESGDYPRAITEVRRLLKDELAILPAGHDAVYRSRRKLVELCIQAGHLPDARAEADALVVEQRRLHGPDSPKVRKARTEIANMYGRAGRADIAVALLGTLLEEQIAADGEESERVQRLRGRLERWRAQRDERS